jgi:hypothetical protein
MSVRDAKPVRRHVYRNHHLDSTRWDRFEHRRDDIIISTSYKAGTTWMQTIVAASALSGESRFGGDVREAWRSWITRGWFGWESDGFPYWSHLHHCRTWWEFRQLPNILLVHHADLLADLEGQMRRVANYLGADVPAARWPHVVNACTFESMKRDAQNDSDEMEQVWKGGAQTFFFKGTNGRWRDVLSAEDLTLYEHAVQRALTADCARWLERGGGAS